MNNYDIDMSELILELKKKIASDAEQIALLQILISKLEKKLIENTAKEESGLKLNS